MVSVVLVEGDVLLAVVLLVVFDVVFEVDVVVLLEVDEDAAVVLVELEVESVLSADLVPVLVEVRVVVDFELLSVVGAVEAVDFVDELVTEVVSVVFAELVEVVEVVDVVAFGVVSEVDVSEPRSFTFAGFTVTATLSRSAVYTSALPRDIS